MKNLYILFLITLSIHLLGNENKDINDPNVTIKILELKISDLETQYKEIQDEQQEHFKNQYDVIEKVEGFYERSWNKLIFLISGLGAIVGIGIPYYMNRKQSKKFEEYNTRLHTYEELIKNYDAKLVEHQEEIEQYLENKKIEIEKKLREIFTQQYERIKEEISLEITNVREITERDVNSIMTYQFLTLSEVNFMSKTYDKAFSCLGKVLYYNLSNNDVFNDDNILFIIEKLELIIPYMGDNTLDIDNREEMLNTLKSLISLNLEDLSQERIEKIIEFIDSH